MIRKGRKIYRRVLFEGEWPYRHPSLLFWRSIFTEIFRPKFYYRRTLFLFFALANCNVEAKKFSAKSENRPVKDAGESEEANICLRDPDFDQRLLPFLDRNVFAKSFVKIFIGKKITTLFLDIYLVVEANGLKHNGLQYRAHSITSCLRPQNRRNSRVRIFQRNILMLSCWKGSEIPF